MTRDKIRMYSTEEYSEFYMTFIIGASVSEPPLVDSTDALSCTIYRYIRPASATAHDI